ncbi:MAG: MaoC family dehydratase [Pseudodonghicola sp.]|nr:MaoC family dehydratase [Pseudodonghicola sp.]
MTEIETALAAQEALIGTEIGLSDWITVDQPMIDAFADITHDHQWIHVNPERAAAEAPFGGTIAHGFLTLSLASRFGEDCFTPMPGEAMTLNYGFNKLRFLSPVPSGARLRGRFTLTAVRQRSEVEVLREFKLSIEIEGHATPAVVADWLAMTIFAAPQD